MFNLGREMADLIYFTIKYIFEISKKCMDGNIYMTYLEKIPCWDYMPGALCFCE